MPGSVSLLTKIEAHSQNVCGMAWSPDGRSFVSGGNDNTALLFDVEDVFRRQSLMDPTANSEVNFNGTSSLHSVNAYTLSNMLGARHSEHRSTITPPRPARQAHRLRATREPYDTAGLHSLVSTTGDVTLQTESLRRLPRGRPPTPPRSPAARLVTFATDLADPNTIGITNAHRYSFYHSAAVKAIAFAPWQSTLLATGGGSNDRQIHFHHTASGTTLAVINVFAQVTSLVWSLTRHEIVATFGYAQPEHDVRIAVFAWPSCECVVSIPWERKSNGEIGRALWAIPYPGGPNDAAPEWLHVADASFGHATATRSGRVRSSAARDDARGRLLPPTPMMTPDRKTRAMGSSRARKFTRGEGETWASRTQEEGSIIIACCDQTVKFFEVWAGKSKGRFSGLGSKAGVLGGSKVLEGWCDGMAIEELGTGEDVIR